MKRNFVSFCTLTFSCIIILKLFINASSTCGSSPPACNTAQVVTVLQITNANIPNNISLSSICNPNRDNTNALLKDLSNVLLSPDERRFLKIDIDYEKSTCGDQSFIIKVPSGLDFYDADVRNVTGVTPLHVTCNRSNFISDINRTLSITINKDENFTIKATLELCDLDCFGNNQYNRIIWQTTTATQKVSVSNNLIPISLNFYNYYNQSCVTVYTCY